MAKLWSTLRGRVRFEHRGHAPITFDQWLESFSFGGVTYPIVGTGAMGDVERLDNHFETYVHAAYKADGIVFACILARQMLFSEARFQWQQIRRGRPRDLFGNEELAILERPWPNGTTGELLARMIQDADLAGNFYAVREGTRLRRLRPDWVDILLSEPPEQAVRSDVVGYVYRPGGMGSDAEPQIFDVEQVVHWSPTPDPDAQYRGMSWLTPVLREIQSDKAATEHKLRFFENGATLQTVLTLGEKVTREQFQEWVRKFNEAHRGVRNAYEPLFLGGGADVKVIGADLRQLDFKATQGAGETRIAAAAGVHPVIVGLSEGLQGSSLNQGNFAAARRLTADKTLRPLWRSAAAALESILSVPSGARLWYDDRDIAFLREDLRDLAEIQRTQAVAIRQLLEVGFEADAAVRAVVDNDMSVLVGQHTGLPSVQLQQAEIDAVSDGDDDASPEGDEQ